MAIAGLGSLAHFVEGQLTHLAAVYHVNYGEKHDEERMFFLQARIARCSSVFRNNEYTNSGLRTTVSLDNFLVCFKILK